MKKKVLHILWDGNLGGVQRYVQYVASAEWDKYSHGICLMTRGGKVLSKDSFAGEVWELGLSKGMQLLKARKLQSIVKEWDPHVIHCHCDTPAFSTQLPSFASRRLIYTEHGDTILRQNRSWLTQALWKRYGLHWDRILLNSKFTQNDFVARFPQLEEKCVVVPNPLLELRSPEAPVAKEPFRIGYFGRLVPNKGVDLLLEAMPNVLEKNPTANLHIFGKGEMEAELKAQAKELDLTEHVNFNGFTTDSVGEMARCQMVIVPSRIEPFGLVAIEALSVSTPVISFAGHGVAEIITHEESGLIVPAFDIAALAEAINRLLADPALAAKWGEEGRRQAETQFSLAHHVEVLADIYE